MIVNPANPVKSVTTEQLQDDLRRQDHQLDRGGRRGPADRPREPRRGVRHARGVLEDRHGRGAVRSGRRGASGDRSGPRRGRRSPGAIGYISLGFVGQVRDPRGQGAGRRRRRSDAEDRRVRARIPSSARCTSSPRASRPGSPRVHRLRSLARDPGQRRRRRGLPPHHVSEGTSK